MAGKITPLNRAQRRQAAKQKEAPAPVTLEAIMAKLVAMEEDLHIVKQQVCPACQTAILLKLHPELVPEPAQDHDHAGT